jgi:filamentous hemagglutinin
MRRSSRTTWLASAFALLLSSPLSTGAAFAVNAVHGANGQFVWANSPKPGFALNVATAGEVQSSALSLPAGSRVNGMRSADAANAAAKSDGYEAPFLSGTSIVAIEVEQGARFVRVFGGDSRQNGTWIMRVEDVVGLTPEQIASKYALPQVPTRITDVQLPPGTKLEVSMAGAISPGASRGVFTGDNGGGGGVQFQIKVTREEMSPFWFVNERPWK